MPKIRSKIEVVRAPITVDKDDSLYNYPQNKLRDFENESFQSLDIPQHPAKKHRDIPVPKLNQSPILKAEPDLADYDDFAESEKPAEGVMIGAAMPMPVTGKIKYNRETNDG